MNVWEIYREITDALSLHEGCASSASLNMAFDRCCIYRAFGLKQLAKQLELARPTSHYSSSKASRLTPSVIYISQLNSLKSTHKCSIDIVTSNMR